MMFADVAKGVVKDALAESISTIAAVFSFLRVEPGSPICDWISQIGNRPVTACYCTVTNVTTLHYTYQKDSKRQK